MQKYTKFILLGIFLLLLGWGAYWGIYNEIIVYKKDLVTAITQSPVNWVMVAAGIIGFVYVAPQNSDWLQPQKNKNPPKKIVLNKNDKIPLKDDIEITFFEEEPEEQFFEENEQETPEPNFSIHSGLPPEAEAFLEAQKEKQKEAQQSLQQQFENTKTPEELLQKVLTQKIIESLLSPNLKVEIVPTNDNPIVTTLGQGFGLRITEQTQQQPPQKPVAEKPEQKSELEGLVERLEKADGEGIVEEHDFDAIPPTNQPPKKATKKQPQTQEAA